MEGVCVVGQQNADIANTLHLRDVAMATPFCLSMGYNFGCMIASDTLLILGVVFGVKPVSYTHLTLPTILRV